MSRLAKKPISIPSGVTVRRDGLALYVEGPKGTIQLTVPRLVHVEETGGALQVSLGPSAKQHKEASALLGTTAALIRNALLGAHDGFEKRLELEGVGYKVQLDGKDLVLSLGFTHPVRISAVPGIAFSVEKNAITVRGADKALVGETAARIRSQKPPEPYKGKGIHYGGEVIRRKAGKKAVGTT